jgi:hypothetical protein
MLLPKLIKYISCVKSSVITKLPWNNLHTSLFQMSRDNIMSKLRFKVEATKLADNTKGNNKNQSMKKEKSI